MKAKRAMTVIALFVVLIVAGYFIFFRTVPIRLSGVEVREYKGQNLSSVVTDFRENSIMGPQHINIELYRLKLSGLVVTPKEYTYDTVIGHQNFEKVVTLHCVEGWSATVLWRGVLIMDIILDAGRLPNANTVIFHCYDGYTTSLPLEYIWHRSIILAYKMNNVTIPDERGFPFMVVAEDKWGYKWAKWVTEIELSDDPNYRGYWESRGYSNTGDTNQPFL